MTNLHRSTFKLTGILHSVEQTPDLIVSVKECSRIDLHHVSVEALLIGRQRVPCGNLARASGHQILGPIIAGALLPGFLHFPGIAGQIISAAIGAIILLFLVNFVSRRAV